MYKRTKVFITAALFMVLGLSSATAATVIMTLYGVKAGTTDYPCKGKTTQACATIRVEVEDEPQGLTQVTESRFDGEGVFLNAEKYTTTLSKEAVVDSYISKAPSNAQITIDNGEVPKDNGQ